MHRFYAFATLLATAIAFAAPAGATDTKPTLAELVTAGHAFALKVCWACHVVGTDQTEKPILPHPASSFPVIAQRSDLTEAALQHFLSSHAKIFSSKSDTSDPRLADDQIDEVVAYIESLKK